ncbi:MAG: hypothetical protein HYY17_02410 [Planctomycetes bacterium]|nr:hypothetical protein [Planctomycetota bacterium]
MSEFDDLSALLRRYALSESERPAIRRAIRAGIEAEKVDPSYVDALNVLAGKPDTQEFYAPPVQARVRALATDRSQRLGTRLSAINFLDKPVIHSSDPTADIESYGTLFELATSLDDHFEVRKSAGLGLVWLGAGWLIEYVESTPELLDTLWANRYAQGESRDLPAAVERWRRVFHQGSEFAERAAAAILLTIQDAGFAEATPLAFLMPSRERFPELGESAARLAVAALERKEKFDNLVSRHRMAPGASRVRAKEIEIRPGRGRPIEGLALPMEGLGIAMAQHRIEQAFEEAPSRSAGLYAPASGGLIESSGWGSLATSARSIRVRSSS